VFPPRQVGGHFQAHEGGWDPTARIQESSFATNVQRLLQLLVDLVPLTAEMDAIIATITPGHPGHGCYFGRVFGAAPVPRAVKPRAPCCMAVAVSSSIWATSLSVAARVSLPTF